MSGWVKIHRKILEWEWFNDTNTFKLFLFILLSVNHKDKNYRGKLVKAGSMVTGRDILAQKTNMSVQQIRSCLKRLKSTNEITIETNSQGTIIHVVNFEKYQVETNELTNNQPTINQQSTTNKNVKNEKNIFKHPTIEEVQNYCLERNNNVDAKRWFDFYVSKGWLVGKSKMKDWKASVRTWEKETNVSPKQPNFKSNDQIFYENVMKQLGK